MPYAETVEKKHFYMLFALALAALVALGAWNRYRDRSTPSVTVESESGEQAQVTPTDRMRVRTAEREPQIDPSTWRLKVSGLVDRELSLTLDEVLGRPAEERLVELPCVEGWKETALWKGVRLAPLLEEAGMYDDAETVVFSSPGGYTTSLTVQDIRETDPLLAYQVNGEPLPQEQGYPLRLVVPQRLGYKWIKWVTGIQAIRGEYEGYWESYGYSNEARAR